MYKSKGLAYACGRSSVFADFATGNPLYANTGSDERKARSSRWALPIVIAVPLIALVGCVI
jgi:hypothetical protein